MTVLEKALVTGYIHTKQAITALDITLIEMKALNDPRAGMFQSLLEKLQGAAKRAYAKIEKNIDVSQLDEEMLEDLDKNWEELK
jgi:hypothetical protein